MRPRRGRRRPRAVLILAKGHHHDPLRIPGGGPAGGGAAADAGHGPRTTARRFLPRRFLPRGLLAQRLLPRRLLARRLLARRLLQLRPPPRLLKLPLLSRLLGLSVLPDLGLPLLPHLGLPRLRLPGGLRLRGAVGDGVPVVLLPARRRDRPVPGRGPGRQRVP